MARRFAQWPHGGASKTKGTELHAGDDRQGTPSTIQYASETAKEFLKALESMSDPIPVPFLKTFLTVAVKVLEACQEVSAVEENVKELQGRVYNLMLVVINSVPMKEQASVELRERVERLQCVLADILIDLAKIKQQRKLLLVVFRALNKDRVDRCVGRLTEALENFQAKASQLRVEDLLAKIKAEHSTVIPQLNRIEDAVKHFSQPHNATAHREDMRLLPPIFLGRDTLVGKIALLLTAQETSRVCITGVGGMGKTSVAVAVTESPMIRNFFLKEYIFWVPCITAKSSDLFRRILYTQLRITAETYDSLDPLIAELNESQQPRLILLDNFETPWLSGPDPLEVGHILRRLAALPHIALLVTMTSGITPEGIKWEHVPLSALEPAAARDLFKNTYRDAAGGLELAADERQLDNVLESIGHIPLAITLMATCGGHLGASLEDLFVDWRKAGTEMLSAGRLSMDDTITLSMERGVTSNPNALRLLAILSMLPAGTTGQNLLDCWAPSIRMSTHAAIEALRTAGVIEQDHGPFVTSRIFVRPTIQSYMAHQDRISADVRNQVHDACYDFVLRHKSIPDDHEFKSDLEALTSEETNIQGLLMEIPVDAPRPNALEALIAFSLYQSWTKPSTVVASHALEVARSVYNDPHVADRDAAARRVAAAHQSLGKSLLTLDRHDEARLHFEKAIARFKALPGGADLHLAGEASMELLYTWFCIGTKSSSELEPLAREAQANLSHDPTSKYHVARGLLAFGRFLWYSHGMPGEEALATLSTAKAIFEHLGCPASTAVCLYYMARDYAVHGRYSEALLIIKDALKNADQSGEVSWMCSTRSTMIRFLLVLGSHEEASTVFPRLLSLSQTMGAPGTIGQVLELLAYNCAAMMDLPGARIAYEGAQMHFNKIESTQLGREGVDRCSGNLRMLEDMTEMDQDNFPKLIEPDPMY
ncbi:hypothetical protein MSAN_00528300 [Mycena sanguinolenta]|uniref:NB-ARC domain-containing protein n=1 Tax=Mycena sanguinolenta TaxID=230812 RepID=A0A8H7DHC0_9AGAR|nr:hypothetical protein MSAN_00528300 [Mycena sanguinolenta]